ncbi:MAG: hypothetical protein J6Y79_05005 [Paludibacteraceae bacterium]|nr:hypothetical protein [Paludibacteraceae bacterium]
MLFVADKEEITTENIVAHFGFTATSAKRYLRQLTDFGYLEAHGGNKNRTYSKMGNLREMQKEQIIRRVGSDKGGH